MSELLPKIEREGVYPQFLKVKSYLKNYHLVFDDWEQDQVPRLKRYTREGRGFKFSYGEGLPIGTYTASTAGSELQGVHLALEWHAIQAALKCDDDWLPRWHRAVAYGYWSTLIDFQNMRERYANADLDGKLQEFLLGTLRLSFTRIIPTMADCLILGWQDWALRLARESYWALARNTFGDADDSYHRRTQHCVLRLVASWQGWPEARISCAFDDPLYNAIVAHWRTPKQEDLAPLLLAACDRHTQQARIDSSKARYDLPFDERSYNPFLVLTVLRLREMNGLENPVLDHILMNTPLGRLYPPVPFYSDELLEGVLVQVRKEYPSV